MEPTAIEHHLPCVLVFKTTVTTQNDIAVLRNTLDEVIGTEGEWNFDLEDCDNILRVAHEAIDEAVVISVLKAHGYGGVALK